ncbi:hypothetical protein [Colwellia piezophila]|uniref:hypothetical protein n=1 Tax=Colwellia piezophila TaxID=211668 RepID=UPI00036AFE54|nr:hypothetical protein [Colwellia piezophila]
MIVCETERLTLRRLNFADAAFIVQLLNEEVLSVTLPIKMSETIPKPSQAIFTRLANGKLRKTCFRALFS